MIKVQHLSKSYGRTKVLDNINLIFEKGNVYGIVGKNGAGKTTFFNCLLGFEKYTGIVDCADGTLKNITGFVPTDPFYLSHITGKEYLQLMCNSRGIKYTSITNKNIFDLPLHRYAENYSTGMKKKLALTGVLLQRNEVFILDEPYNGVDIESTFMITELIKQLKEADKTILLSSHIFSTLEENCDCIYYLENGTVSGPLYKNDFFRIKDKLTPQNTVKINFDI